jgi:hypothetical protein
MSAVPDRDSFAGVLGSPFTLTAAGGQSVDVELTEVTELKETANQRSFALLFSVPEPYQVEQGLYDLDHKVLGSMQLFLVPVGMDNGRWKLEAVFNLVKETSG